MKKGKFLNNIGLIINDRDNIIIEDKITNPQDLYFNNVTTLHQNNIVKEGLFSPLKRGWNSVTKSIGKKANELGLGKDENVIKATLQKFVNKYKMVAPKKNGNTLPGTWAKYQGEYIIMLKGNLDDLKPEQQGKNDNKPIDVTTDSQDEQKKDKETKATEGQKKQEKKPEQKKPDQQNATTEKPAEQKKPNEQKKPDQQNATTEKPAGQKKEQTTQESDGGILKQNAAAIKDGWNVVLSVMEGDDPDSPVEGLEQIPFKITPDSTADGIAELINDQIKSTLGLTLTTTVNKGPQKKAKSSSHNSSDSDENDEEESDGQDTNNRPTGGSSGGGGNGMQPIAQTETGNGVFVPGGGAGVFQGFGGIPMGYMGQPQIIIQQILANVDANPDLSEDEKAKDEKRAKLFAGLLQALYKSEAGDQWKKVFMSMDELNKLKFVDDAEVIDTTAEAVPSGATQQGGTEQAQTQA